jgi:hypothetical protein
MFAMSQQAISAASIENSVHTVIKFLPKKERRRGYKIFVM